jgi:hypothetical protein
VPRDYAAMGPDKLLACLESLRDGMGWSPSWKS